MPPLLNPVTGELLDGSSVDDLRVTESVLSDQIGPLWRAREEVRRLIADRTQVAAMPKPRYRTDTQRTVSQLCPRCREKFNASVPR